ncbi:hypothetical protein [Synechococcus sp. UW179A]|uniref:hypothetical protein n=1 Tax=Synechococcus sp. UW179A TaxID=2575510 RepID=UPI000E0E1FBD|nr:hypothetical protein [Synechococcus sp. UW179A]
MALQHSAPSCFMHWSVQRVTNNLFSVSATSDGRDYTHVGNYRSVEDANRAGRHFVSVRAHEQGHNTHDRADVDAHQQGSLTSSALHS